ncbi:MAG: beta-ketoacyl-[acyl-carrier-protein] synthase family protein, partial [Ktedonobacteraceae bacterium]|nr:beta-ketoacyl-[acyl-carrier-protein] synthase family protein [Ktedonobacteraceae bacterium]
VFLILEELEHAQARGAAIYGELQGWATGTDGYLPFYTVEPHGRVLARTIQQCLHHAGSTPREVDVIFAHGSAVPVEDTTEVYAIKAAFGERSRQIAVTAPRSAIGHMLGAAAPADVALACKAMASETIPPTANLDEPAPGLDLNFVQHRPRSAASCRRSLVISRGSGGVNVCLLVSVKSA